VKNILKRVGWILLALLFVITGLGVGVVAFWQATHQPKDNTAQQQQANACTIQTVTSSAVFPKPQVYKPAGDVSSLQKTDLQPGTGQEIKPGDCLTVKYYGTLTNGTVFDENYDKPSTLKLKIGEGQVIPGWDEGIPGMKVGGTRRLVIPPSLGYGSQGSGTIPANSTLVFEVKAITIEE
jgi:FKBP-type peptidyl-prolyl cis-trans isomerase